MTVVLFTWKLLVARRGKFAPPFPCCRLRLKCDGTRAETRFSLPAKRTSPFKSARASFQSTTGSRGVRISGSNGRNAGYVMFWGSVKITGYPLHSPVCPSFPLPCVTVCHHISTGLYYGCIPLYGRGVVTFAWSEEMCIAAVSNVSTVQPSTLYLSARFLTCLSDVPVSVLFGRTSVLDVFTVRSMV